MNKIIKIFGAKSNSSMGTLGTGRTGQVADSCFAAEGTNILQKHRKRVIFHKSRAVIRDKWMKNIFNIANFYAKSYNTGTRWNRFRERYRDLAEGRHRAMTIKDIAEKSGYAVSTVSRALNHHPDVSKQAKEEIWRVVEQTGFVPNANARKLKQTETKSILFLVKSTGNMFFDAMLVELQSLASAAGYEGVTQYLEEDDDEVLLAVQLCKALRPKGIVFLGGNSEHFAQNFGRVTVPCVLATMVDASLRFEQLSMVGVNDCKAACKAVEHLLDAGHRNLVILGGDPKVSYPSSQRLRGCKMAFANRGIQWKDEACLTTSFSFAGAYNTLHQWLQQGHRPDAIFAMSDTTAIGAMRALADHGLRVPQDVSVVGFDGLELSQFCTPRLCTMCQPAQRIAQESIRLVLDCIQNQAPAQSVVLEATLLEGESVAMRAPC